ncbi:hypothetical protein CI109_105532 [Kwoniella shandongensis]|uniref:Uncharacterized protein n=1 Tax=Kwoniella shandongensis TaxID=1734106 RepID=A0A5M6C3T3_9TREE|nr:uncharacterized protein CI109_002253 [Kwoniella shandongensis]KAA5529360.1 hypothetical protein CI109_002253 [Kwoniella shandongensis]
MPAFYPPLASTTSVPIPSASSPDSFVHLNFFLTFEDGEDSSGSWEIWTDLPQFDNQGNVITQPGEWRAATFTPYQDITQLSPNGVKQNGQSSTPTIHVQALSNYPTATPSPETLFLTAVVPAAINNSYSYTFRHNTEGGETHWLGGVGGNGFIKLEDGEVEVTNEPLTAGSWSHKPQSLEKLEWRGVGIDLINDKIPRISTLPSETATSPTIALLEATPALHLTPFSKISSSSSSIFPKPSVHNLAVVGSLSTPLTVPASATSPSTSNSTSANYGLAVNSPLHGAVAAALKASKIDQSRVRLGKVSGDDDVTALLVSAGDEKPVSNHLVLYAPYASRSRQVTINVPEALDRTPLAVISSSSSPVYLPGQGDRKVDIHLDAGAVAEVLRLSEFIEVRGAGSVDSIWISAPDATAYEIGEEELDLPKDKLAQAANLAPTRETPSHASSDTIQAIVVASDGENGLTEEDDEDDTTVVETAPTEEGWFFHFIGRFFVNIWHLLLSAFRSKAVPDTDAQDPTTDSDDDTERFETQTPADADEKTPLLDTLSRATSSTAYSPLISPSSEASSKTITKPSENLTTLSKLISANDDNTDVNLPVTNTVKIRSYAQLTFNHPSPFQLYLPPGTKGAQDKLRFALKTKEASKWDDVVPKFIEKEEKCVELLVEGGEGQGKEWQVQIEHV